MVNSNNPDYESSQLNYCERVSELRPGSTVYFDIDGTSVDVRGNVIDSAQKTWDFIHGDNPDIHLAAITNRPRSQGIPELRPFTFESEIYREDLDQSLTTGVSRYELLEILSPDRLHYLKTSNPLLLHEFLNMGSSKIDYLYRKHGIAGLSEILLIDDGIDGELAEIFGFGVYSGNAERKTSSGESINPENFSANEAISLLTQIPQYEIVRFFEAVDRIARILDQTKPKQLVIPERSAVPIYWGMPSIRNNISKTAPQTAPHTAPQTHFIPIGETIDPVSGGSFDNYSYQYIFNIFKTLGVAPDMPTSLILEVVTGNKAAYLMKFCEHYFQPGKVQYILAVESRRKKIRRLGVGGYYSADVVRDKRYLNYLDLLGSRAIEIATPLVFDNRSALLNRIILGSFSDNQDRVESNIYGLPRIVQNNFARRLVEVCGAKTAGDKNSHTYEELLEQGNVSERNRTRFIQWIDGLSSTEH